MFVQAPDRLFVLDRATGSTLWTLRGRYFLVDVKGVLRRGSPRELSHHDLDGERLWEFRKGVEGATLLPDRVLIGCSGNVFMLDRTDGTVREAWSTGEAAYGAAARSCLYGTEYAPDRCFLVADAPGGARLWESALDLGLQPGRLAPVHRGVIALTGSGDLVRYS